LVRLFSDWLFSANSVKKQIVMGCNCKKKVNKKYSDGDDGRVERGWFGKAAYITANVFLSIVGFAISIVATPFFAFYILLTSASGKGPTIYIPFLKKKNKVDSDGQ